MLQHANVHTHPHTRVCVGVCVWSTFTSVSAYVESLELHQYLQGHSYTTEFQLSLFIQAISSPLPGSNQLSVFLLTGLAV